MNCMSECSALSRVTQLYLYTILGNIALFLACLWVGVITVTFFFLYYFINVLMLLPNTKCWVSFNRHYHIANSVWWLWIIIHGRQRCAHYPHQSCTKKSTLKAIFSCQPINLPYGKISIINLFFFVSRMSS